MAMNSEEYPLLSVRGLFDKALHFCITQNDILILFK